MFERRKLLELGYKRTAKKCKEKFENVQKYHKRTKETRGGGNENKTYKFFSELEALNTPPPHYSSLDVSPLSFANRIQPLLSSSQHLPVFSLTQPPRPHTASFNPNVAPPPPPSVGPTFSSHSSSTASRMGSDDDVAVDDQDGPSSRKCGSKMMKLFESLSRKMIHKQTAMQRRFLEALEKREQERLHREEAWKRQQVSRLAQEHELTSQERAVSASRDAAIISLIQKITGHTIQLPPSLLSSSQPPSDPKRIEPIVAISQPRILPHHQQEVIMSSEQSLLPSTSRWPKAEILALINVRSGMEPKYQDNVPKGVLWEDIASSMKRMGYNRNAKRCKEKWENINKYYKKVKESQKTRPQDAKTCPYFDRLDLLYRNKVVGSDSTCGLQLQDQTSTVQKQSPLVNIDQSHGLASSDDKELRHESPQGVEKEDYVMREMMQQQESMIGDYEEIEKSRNCHYMEDGWMKKK
ncbi:unnamed protein product [Cochlearia groenlandica]